MKPFEQLTRLGKIERMRQAARLALDAYGLTEARYKLLRVAGNTVFRVYDTQYQLGPETDSTFEPGQYLLRLHAKNEQETKAIRLEMAWLAAIRKDAGLQVPEPVTNLDGELMTQVVHPGIPEILDCTLLRWIRGRFVSGNGKPYHYRAQGRVMAQLHNHAAGLRFPSNLTKRRFDWYGMFQANVGAKIPSSEAWPLLADKFAKPYREVADEVKELMDIWGTGPDVFGLIHADCGLDANVIFSGGEARIIDFDGSGFGYWIYDLAIAMEHCWEDPDYLWFRQVLLEGYDEYRSLPREQLVRQDLFLAAYYVYMGLWETAVMYTSPPGTRDYMIEWQEYGLKFINDYLASR